jgi:hypothetical protein
MENSEIAYNLKRRVMRRIYVVYARNLVYKNGFLVAASLVLVVLFFSISISDVIKNTPKESFASVSSYMLGSFNRTEATTKALVSLLALCAVAPLINLGSASLRRSQDLLPPSWTRDKSRLV